MAGEHTGRVARRLLNALGLARAADVEHERTLRKQERERADRKEEQALAARAAQQEHERRREQHVRASHAARLERARRVTTSLEHRLSAQHAEAAQRIEALKARLLRAEQKMAMKKERGEGWRTERANLRARVATLAGEVRSRRLSERRLKTLFGDAGAALHPVLAIRAARPAPPSAEAATRESRLASLSPEYVAARACCQTGAVPEGTRHVSISGLQWSVPIDAGGKGSLSQRILEHEWLPLDDVAAVRQLVVGGVMLDIGANIGTTSIPRLVLGDFTCVYGAEPNSDNYRCLVRNVLDNGLTGRVIPDRVAIASNNGTARLRRASKIGGHHLMPANSEREDGFEDVPCFTLDSWLERLGVEPDAVSFVKVDTQGWDLHVLQGAASLLAHRNIVWQIEVSPSLMRNAGSSVDDLCALIDRHFTHIKELGGHSSDRWLPAAETARVVGSVNSDRSFANLLLFNLADPASGR